MTRERERDSDKAIYLLVVTRSVHIKQVDGKRMSVKFFFFFISGGKKDS